MRDTESIDAKPRLVCPACGAPVALPAADAPTMCSDCRAELDVRALADELVTLTRFTGPTPADLHRLRLSAVERELLSLLLQGYRVNQIATRVDATVPTVRKRVRRLLAKTGTSSQAELIESFRD